jgi:lysophospholipase L1-like esterase
MLCVSLLCGGADRAWSQSTQVAPPSQPDPPEADAYVAAALAPFWNARQLREPLFFIQSDPAARPRASLLFKPEKIVSVTSASRETTYDGRDFAFDEATGTLYLPVGSRIPFKTMDTLYPLLTSGAPKIRGKRGDPARGIFWGEGALYHGLQVEVTYDCAPGQWAGYVPKFSGDALPRTMKKLTGREPVKVLLSGDSISEGYNASQFTKTRPGCPPFGELVALALQKHYGSPVTFENHAHGGWNAQRGLKQATDEKLGARQPDLVMIAFGMNDVFGRKPAAYQENIRGIMEAIRKDSPDTEFVLVASMLGNVEWGMPMEQFPLYRDALKELCGPGGVLADMTAVWEELLKRKSFYDLTGNGVNHPNDFGHCIYAQTILSLLVPAEPAAPQR